MTAEIISLDEHRARRRDAVLPWLVFATVCFWPAFLVFAAGLGARDAIVSAWEDQS